MGSIFLRVRPPAPGKRKGYGSRGKTSTLPGRIGTMGWRKILLVKERGGTIFKENGRETYAVEKGRVGKRKGFIILLRDIFSEKKDCRGPWVGKKSKVGNEEGFWGLYIPLLELDNNFLI